LLLQACQASLIGFALALKLLLLNVNDSALHTLIVLSLMDRNFALALILLYAIIVPVYVKKKGVVSYAFLAQRNTHTQNQSQKHILSMKHANYLGTVSLIIHIKVSISVTYPSIMN
jgi:hypothetical protein